ncbi:hypothetical protein SAMN04488122_4778 [Chitinophaga arvensicola]|uniref:Uncharacterized protein n=1 Tax=Chitinophaga arvensicola TaxID=29529 RepID=A0A1I0SAH4_9BACT|nr:hypothetical protein SAMN04488122_4778 [Chitinophaga arvensicola]
MPDKFNFDVRYVVIDLYGFSRFADNGASIFIE